MSDFNMHEVVTRRMIVERSKKVFVAADSSKFDRDITVNIVTLDNIDYIVTDSNLNKSIINKFKKLKTNIILAED
ncbi:hypothetical protein [Gottschalkia acidurici]|uniref:hypothetical protein n=1 Tax=Clostridium acidurici TaxID=1556 RepID=UPI001E3931AE|nr:hypothetical protein [Gottschalkia acidurici]